MNLTDKQYKFIAFLAFAFSTILFISIAYTSFGYDDEYWNIRMIEENSLGILINKIQSSDVHPPLSYIINFFLYRLFNNWTSVRVFSAILYLITLLYTVSKTKNQEIRIILILLLGFNPTIMLWVTSIRWYAYAIPLLMILSIPLESNNKYYWYYFFFGFLALSFLSYIGMILILPYFVWYYLQLEGSLVNRIKRIIIPGLLYLIFYSYQIYIFYSVHRFNNIEDNQQTFDFITSLKSYVSSAFANQAIFPISIIGIISILGYLIVSIVLITTLKNRNNIKILSLFFLSSILYLITGVAGKLRNLVLLDISKAHLISNGIISKYKKMLYTGLTIILIANSYGIFNVWSHQRTTKNAWNLPLAKSMELMNRLEVNSSREVYFTFHPSYTYHLTKQNKDLISFYTSYYFDSTKIKTTIDKLSNERNLKNNFNFILTYRGRSIEENHYKEMIEQMKALKADSIKIYKLGFDSDYKLKQKIYPDYPKYTFYLYKYYGVKSNILGLKVWEKNKL